MPSSLLNDLNDSQRQAVTHREGPLLVLAGAGSGKTRALTYRAAYLIEQGIAPERILLTTFTNKAAQEMQTRLDALVHTRLPFAGTFHSLCARFLRKHGPEIGLDRDFVIYDSDDQQTVIKQALRDLNLDPKEVRPRSVLNIIEQAKHQLISPDDYADYARGPQQQTAARLYRRYQELLQAYNAVDFNDLLVKTVALFSHVPHVSQKYQDQFLHVLVDEYQDTNKAQYALTKLWGAKHRNICVVGDASQAIYSWRGADYQNLILLEQDFRDLTIIKLEQNYRSTQNILDAAHGVINHNTLHPVLSLWTQSPAGELVTVTHVNDEYAEATFILDTLKAARLEDETKKLSDFVVLYRTNAQSRALEEIFIRSGVPYVLVGGVKFYERKEVKDVLSYVRFTANRSDQVARSRIEKLGKRRLLSFDHWLDSRADLTVPPLTLLEAILSATNYIDQYDPKLPEDLARIENVNELKSVAASFESITDFLENVSLVEQDTHHQGWVTPSTAISQTKNQDAVIFMTLHASKGLEFDTVFMIGMEEGLFPHSRSLLSKAELEEERRLCYVGLTRAKRLVYLTHTTNRLYFGTRSYNQPSRFLSEIPPTLLNSSESGKPQSSRLPSSLDLKKLDAFLNDEIDINEFLRD